MRLRDLVAASLAAPGAPEPPPRAPADGEAGTLLAGAKRRPVIVQVAPHRRRWRLHPLAIATALLVAFCGALYGARAAGWSAVLLSKLEATLWPKQSEPAATDDHAAGSAAKRDAVQRQGPQRAPPADDLRRGFAEYQRRMLEAAGAEASPPAPLASPETQEPAAGTQQEQAARPPQGQADHASPARRPEAKRARPRYTSPQREYPAQQHYWDAPGYTAR